MSAWMTGIGMGMDLARQRAAQQTQAQEFAYRQQQDAINNQQQDRAFQAQQQYQDQMRQMREMEYADRKAELTRRLSQDQYDAQIFKAAAQPDLMAQAPGGVGPVPQHPLTTLTDDVVLGASPSGRAAYLASMQRNAGFNQRRTAAAKRIEMARADGTLKYMSDKDFEEFNNLGLIGELAPDEMPMSVRKQQQEQHDQLAQFMSVTRTPDGDLVSDPQKYEMIRGLDPKLAQALFLRQQQQEAIQRLTEVKAGNAMDLAQIRQMVKGAQPAKRDDALLNTLQEKYRALTGKDGKNGPIIGPTAKEREMAKETNLDTGWMDFTGPEPEDVDRAQQKVKIWDQMEAIINGTAPQPQQRGLLDGPEAPSQSGADPEAIFQQLEAEMPNATDEQIAAELQRRLQGG